MSDKLNNLEEASPTYEQKDNIYYNCTECSSMIEILEINKEMIKFKCINNKHEISMGINEYLEKMKKYNDIKINNDKCNIHNNKYISYCFDCNNHLCNECLKNREHINHYKNYIIEINPNKEELDKLNKMINENKNIINKRKWIKKKLEKYKNNINNNYYNAKNINNILINYYNNNIIINNNNQILNNIIIEDKLEKQKQNENKIKEYENKLKDTINDCENKLKEYENK